MVEIQRLAEFLEVPHSTKLLHEISDSCSFNKLKKADDTLKEKSKYKKIVVGANPKFEGDVDKVQYNSFFRKGKSTTVDSNLVYHHLAIPFIFFLFHNTPSILKTCGFFSILFCRRNRGLEEPLYSSTKWTFWWNVQKADGRFETKSIFWIIQGALFSEKLLL